MWEKLLPTRKMLAKPWRAPAGNLGGMLKRWLCILSTWPTALVGRAAEPYTSVQLCISACFQSASPTSGCQAEMSSFHQLCAALHALGCSTSVAPASLCVATHRWPAPSPLDVTSRLEKQGLEQPGLTFPAPVTVTVIPFNDFQLFLP